jgi:hypothetical protein
MWSGTSDTTPTDIAAAIASEIGRAVDYRRSRRRRRPRRRDAGQPAVTGNATRPRMPGQEVLTALSGRSSGVREWPRASSTR